MHVANNIERSVLVLQVVPQRLPLDDRAFDFLERFEHENMAKALPLKTAQGPMQLLGLLPNDMRTKVAVRPPLVPVVSDPLRQVQDNGHGQTMKLACDFHKWLARLRLDIRCIRNCQSSRREPLAGDKMEQIKSVLRRRLAILVIGHQPAAIIRRENLRWLEM